MKHTLRMITISLVDGCNLKCRWCDRPDGYEFMELDTLSHIVDLINEEVACTPLLQVIGAGEMLLHPRFVEAMRILKGITIPNMRVELWTNGTVIEEHTIKSLLEMNFLHGLVFSFDGYGDAETFEYIRSGANYDKVVGNINNVCRWRAEVGCSVELSISSILPTSESLPFPKPDESQIKAKYQEMFPDVDTTMFRSVHRYNGSYEVDGMPAAKTGAIGPCLSLEERCLIISAAGNVYPCCADINYRLQMGNLLDSSISDIFSGERFLSMRDDLRAGKEIPVCSGCDGCKYLSEKSIAHTYVEKYAQLRSDSFQMEQLIGQKQALIEQQAKLIDEKQLYIDKQANLIGEKQLYIDKQAAVIEELMSTTENGQS